MSDLVISDLKQTNPTLIVEAGLKSLVMLSVPPGTGLFREAWGIKNLNIGGISSGQSFSGIVYAAKALLGNTNAFYLAFFGLSLAFSITIKLLAVVGIVNLIRTEKAPMTLFILMSTVLMVSSYLFLGQPRFRVPLEPILTYLAILGLYAWWKVWPCNRNKMLAENKRD